MMQVDTDARRLLNQLNIIHSDADTARAKLPETEVNKLYSDHKAIGILSWQQYLCPKFSKLLATVERNRQNNHHLFNNENEQRCLSRNGLFWRNRKHNH